MNAFLYSSGAPLERVLRRRRRKRRPISHLLQSAMAAATALKTAPRGHFPPSVGLSTLDTTSQGHGGTNPTKPLPETPRKRASADPNASKSSLSTEIPTPKLKPKPQLEAKSLAVTAAPLPQSRSKDEAADPSSRARRRSTTKKPSKESSSTSRKKTEKPAETAASSSKRGPLTYHNLAQASLSTPELHLASDPLMDADDAEHRHLVFPSSSKGKQADSAQKMPWPSAAGSKDSYGRARSAEHLPLSGEVPFSSLGAVLGAVQEYNATSSSSSNLAIAPSSIGKRTKKISTGSTVVNNNSVSAATPKRESSAASLRQQQQQQQQQPSIAKKPSASNWFRSRKWSAVGTKSKETLAAPAAIQSKEAVAAPVAVVVAAPAPAPSPAATKTAHRAPTISSVNASDSSLRIPSPDESEGGAHWSTSMPFRPSTSSSVYDSSFEVSTMDNASSMFFSDSAVTSSMSQATVPTDISSPSLNSTIMTLERLRSARTYMIEQLSKLSNQEMGEDRERVASLAWFSREKEAGSRGLEMDASREMLEFWMSISSGVLLCVLANRLRPGAIDRIDRRDIEWVKADNLSRFLRAARDHFGVRSKDLFHPLDLADATKEGLDRAVQTILAVQRSARNSGLSVRSPSSPVVAAGADRISSGRLSLMTSPPLTPDASAIDLPMVDVSGAEDSPAGSPSVSPSRRGGNTKVPMLTVHQHRQAAEAKLVRAISPTPLAAEAQLRARRRRSSDASSQLLAASRAKAPIITFAEGSHPSRSSLDDDSKMPYRDRKMSESALSLTGVAEEDTEDTIAASSASPSMPSVEKMEVVSESAQAPTGPTLMGAGANRPRASSPMARHSSQRRISQEIGLGLNSSPKAVRGSFDGGPEMPSSGSPGRQAPARRHSTRAGINGPSALNPSRDSAFTLANSGDASPSRVPFPRSSASSDNSVAKRASTNLSLQSSDSGVSGAASPFGNYWMVPASPKLSAARPMYRHMRYTSELHLPVSQRGSFARSDEDRSNVSPPATALSSAIPMPLGARGRFDSEVGSLYAPSSSLPTADDAISVSGSTTMQARLNREASVAPTSRHKLVLTGEGKDVTYQMGNCIGRGQFGSVYRALNLNSGQMVAVKRIKLEGRSEDEVTELMNEVDLLKSLTHPSVVKYEGLVRGPEVVSIILEYVENGSLLHTLKAFGNFPEKLVASYVVKILEGLNYLHEMKVVHCDLKAANILTTKNGNVKLSDFGVSLNLKAMEKVKKNDAIGTPNWMAPEVIELKGASTAADIWSLGCTIIELLTGKPPYGDMLAMSAMFRIVEDDRPPLPEKCSDLLRDFLILCFDKDPTKRPSAEALVEHDWLMQMWTGHKELRPQDSVPFLRRISVDSRRNDVRMLQPGVHEVVEPQESSNVFRGPSTAASRSSYDNKRSVSSPVSDTWAAAGTPTDNEFGGALSPTSQASPTNELPSPSQPHGFQHEASASTSQVQSPVEPTRTGPSLNPSVLDLTAGDSGIATPSPWGEDGEQKPHSFVKSTFSKAVRCRICKDSVRRHAVLCEDCGLICHASCARDVASPCNIRAQLMMYQNTNPSSTTQVPLASPSQTGASPASSLNGSSSALTDLTNAAAAFLPAGFKFPFGKQKRQSRTHLDRVPTSELSKNQPPSLDEMGADKSAVSSAVAFSSTASGIGSSVAFSPEPSVVSSAGVTAGPGPVPAIDREKGTAVEREGGEGRRRRISLRPSYRGRARSPSPKPALAPTPAPAPASAAAAPESKRATIVKAEIVGHSNDKNKGVRRASSISYGSISGSSSISDASHVANVSSAMDRTMSASSAGRRTVIPPPVAKDPQQDKDKDKVAKKPLNVTGPGAGPYSPRVSVTKPSQSTSTVTAAVSTPQLAKAEQSAPSPLGGAFGRRFSSAWGETEQARASKPGTPGAPAGTPVTPTGEASASADAKDGKRRSRRTSLGTKQSKDNCVVM